MFVAWLQHTRRRRAQLRNVHFTGKKKILFDMISRKNTYNKKFLYIIIKAHDFKCSSYTVCVYLQVLENSEADRLGLQEGDKVQGAHSMCVIGTGCP